MLVGIVSERDYVRKVILKGRGSQEVLVRDIMSHPVLCIYPDSTIEQTMALMTNNHMWHLPVVSGEKVLGVISIGDGVKSIIEDKEFEIQQWTNYITGGLTSRQAQTADICARCYEKESHERGNLVIAMQRHKPYQVVTVLWQQYNTVRSCPTCSDLDPRRRGLEILSGNQFHNHKL